MITIHCIEGARGNDLSSQQIIPLDQVKQGVCVCSCLFSAVSNDISTHPGTKCDTCRD